MGSRRLVRLGVLATSAVLAGCGADDGDLTLSDSDTSEQIVSQIADRLGCSNRRYLSYFNAPIRGARAGAGIVCDSDEGVLHVFGAGSDHDPGVPKDYSLRAFGVDREDGRPADCSDWIVFEDQFVVAAATRSAAEEVRQRLGRGEMAHPQSLPVEYGLPSGCGENLTYRQPGGH